MHYYQFNIADYRKDTQHLTPIEHYIYRELIDWLYLDERPIKIDIGYIVRRLRLTNDRSTDVQQVLNEYFTDDGEGYVQQRVSRDIEDYHKKQKAAVKAGKASGKARRSKARERSFDSVEQNCDSVEPTINHKPLTTNQEPVLKDNVPTAQVKTPRSSPVPVQEIVNNWNDFAEINRLPKVVKVTNTLRGQIRQRWTDIPSMAQWDNFFHAISSSTFLSGKAPPGNGRTQPFRSTLLWITKETNFAKIAAGEYS